jgi:hypothetical protein
MLLHRGAALVLFVVYTFFKPLHLESREMKEPSARSTFASKPAPEPSEPAGPMGWAATLFSGVKRASAFVKDSVWEDERFR